jgi:hypothetical protein
MVAPPSKECYGRWRAWVLFSWWWSLTRLTHAAFYFGSEQPPTAGGNPFNLFENRRKNAGFSACREIINSYLRSHHRGMRQLRLDTGSVGYPKLIRRNNAALSALASRAREVRSIACTHRRLASVDFGLLPRSKLLASATTSRANHHAQRSTQSAASCGVGANTTGIEYRTSNAPRVANTDLELIRE